MHTPNPSLCEVHQQYDGYACVTIELSSNSLMQTFILVKLVKVRLQDTNTSIACYICTNFCENVLLDDFSSL